MSDSGSRLAVGYRLPATQCLDGIEYLLTCYPEFLHDARRWCVAFGEHGQEDVFGRDVFIVQDFGFFLCEVQSRCGYGAFENLSDTAAVSPILSGFGATLRLRVAAWHRYRRLNLHELGTAPSSCSSKASSRCSVSIWVWLYRCTISYVRAAAS